MRLLTLNETANECRISRRTLYRRLDDGSFPKPIRIGRRRLWPDELLADWVRGQSESHVTCDMDQPPR